MAENFELKQRYRLNYFLDVIWQTNISESHGNFTFTNCGRGPNRGHKVLQGGKDLYVCVIYNKKDVCRGVKLQ